MSKFIFAVVSSQLVLSQLSNILPPPAPLKYPSTDQSQMISGDLLTDPLITNALKYVESVVSPTILNIKVSTYQSGSTVTYNDNPANTCYWPNDLCVRSAETTDYKKDVFVCPNANDWGLTYDDGPSVDPTAGTSQLLDSLNVSNNLKATFFIVGSNAVQFPDVLKKMHENQHQLASHSWSHHPLTSLTNAQVVAEIKYTESVIYNATGIVPSYFRPPYGDIDDRIRGILSALGYHNILWTTTPPRDTQDASSDTSPAKAASIVQNVKDTFFPAQAGFISLQHDTNSFTVGVGISVLNEITKAGPTFPLKVQPVGQCQGITSAQWYQVAGSVVPPVNNSTTGATPGASTSTVSGTTETSTTGSTITPGTTVNAKSSASKYNFGT
ncbi:chitin deacetylase, partial [Lobulomyces angularis]